jgi:hypothetical protein
LLLSLNLWRQKFLSVLSTIMETFCKPVWQPPGPWSGRRRRTRSPLRWPTSAAHCTCRFPACSVHETPSFEIRAKGSIEQGSQVRTHRKTESPAAVTNRCVAIA